MNLLIRSMRVATALALALFVVTAAPADTRTKEKKKAATNKAAKAAPSKSKAPTKSAAKPTPAPPKAPKPAAPAPKPQSSSGEAREWAPMAATTGALGLFTLETGELLPKGGFSGNIYGNKFQREPGSLSIVNLGWTFGVGLHDRVTAFVNFEPYRHIHMQRGNRLSVNTPLTNPQFGTTIYRSLLPVVGSAPGYAEDFPYANRNGGGVGEVALGVRFALASERLGHAVNLSAGYDFVIPTRTQLGDLLDNQVQRGTYHHGPSVAFSKTWGSFIQTSAAGSYHLTRNSEFGGVTAFQAADQVRLGAGFLLFPEKRWQFMNEYNGLIFVGDSTPNTSFGVRDPVDGIWGMRFYMSPWNHVALDLGYRFMLNLDQHGDRHGFVVKLGTAKWGARPEPPPANRAPTAACSADKSGVYAESGEAVRVSMRASDPDNDTLSYSWTASGGRVEGSGPEVTWSSTGVSPGVYTVTGTVNDGKGGTASCAVDIRVDPRPNRAPSLTCSAERSTVLAGERVRITGRGADPDGETLTYSWRTNGGRLEGSGPVVQLDTSGLNPGRYTVTGRAEDPRGGAADCSVNIGIEAPPPPPQASKLNECFFRSGSARVDNVCKRILDDVALRMQNDPRARIVVVGYADPREPNANRLAARRADEAKKYLASKGVASARIDVRAAGGQAGAGRQNRRIDVVWVPEGATY